MNAPTKIKNESQSLIDHCKDRHWKLMQLFAEAEIAMAEKIGSSAPETFGSKINLLGDTCADKATRTVLVGARNLAAHALITTVERNGEWLSCWRVADRKFGPDSRMMSKAAVTHWADHVSRSLRDLLVKMAKSDVASA